MTRGVHVVIHGRVQGVGYRNWTCREATKLGLAGWVRNRTDGTVEAVFQGPDASVEVMLDACKKGPLLAKVDVINVTGLEISDISGFAQRKTA